MSAIVRTLRYIFRYKVTLAASMACAIFVALLWGANIGGIYPVIEVIFRGQSLQKWVANDIAKAETTIAGIDQRVLELQQPQPPEQQQSAELELTELTHRRTAEQTFLDGRRWLEPYIQQYLPDDPFQTLVVVMMVLLAGTILKNVFLVFDSILVDRLTMLAMSQLRKKFFRRTLRLDLAHFGESNSSELLSRFTNDMDALHGGVQTLLGRAIREPLKMLACVIGAALVSWQLLFFSLICAPLMGYLVSRLAKSLKRANRRIMEEITQLYSILGEVFSSIKVVQAFTRERRERVRFHRNNKEIFRRAMKISRYDALVNPLTELMGISAICVGILAGSYLVLKQQTHLFGIPMCDRPMSMASLMVFYGLLVGTMDPARKLTDSFNRLQKAAAAGERVYAYLDREPTIRDPQHPVNAPRLAKSLSLSGIRFGYKPDQTILHNLHLEIKAGETIAIVGPNGCGKSTLLNLIPRFYDPQSGCVEIDGIDIRNLRRRDLRQQISVVTQDAMLFDDTVFNNIRYSAPGATYEQVIAAAKQAHAHRFIEEQLTEGYDTLIGPMGGRLSGGQRQRIALARAMLRDPALLLLDEATSQIDPESEQEIHTALEEFIRGRTSIMVTHRMSTLDLADRIVVMDRGTIVDQGTHAELLPRCKMYSRLYHAQLREAA
jgi:subfamily B ATP-binding cassette protein MsbA